MSEILALVGERIRNFRKEKGLSQEELAHLASLHPTYIGQIERAEKNVTLESLDKLTRALGISLETLFQHIQPASDEDAAYTLPQLVTLLQTKSLEDQQYALKLIQQMLDWKYTKI
ncbi:helix-turn-helix domain-containing protein [Cohnella soli]|uniref:Helix-turn-helix domain-containing protein n=1 Tax=Cohnella soli TaxID=425005 RepID=A0ABW0HV51_9BACL